MALRLRVPHALRPFRPQRVEQTTSQPAGASDCSVRNSLLVSSCCLQHVLARVQPRKADGWTWRCDWGVSCISQDYSLLQQLDIARVVALPRADIENLLGFKGPGTSRGCLQHWQISRCHQAFPVVGRFPNKFDSKAMFDLCPEFSIALEGRSRIRPTVSDIAEEQTESASNYWLFPNNRSFGMASSSQSIIVSNDTGFILSGSYHPGLFFVICHLALPQDIRASHNAGVLVTLDN